MLSSLFSPALSILKIEIAFNIFSCCLLSCIGVDYRGCDFQTLKTDVNPIGQRMQPAD